MIDVPCDCCGSTITLSSGWVGYAIGCPTCQTKLRVPGEPPVVKPIRRGIHGYAAFWLGIVSLALCFPLGLASIGLGIASLIKEHDRGYGVAGIALGIFALFLWFIITVALLSQM